MRSGTSFFNKTLIATDFRRYWPILFGYTAVWMALPLNQWTDSQYGVEQYPGTIIYEIMPMALAVAVIFGCAMAMALFSYLTNSRAVGLMHSLPVRRITHFVSHLTAGLAMFTAGNVVVALLTVLVQAATGGLAVKDVLVWLAVVTMLDVIFFSMAVLCCMFTGWLLAVPVLYGAMNGIVAVTYALLQTLGSLFYFGFSVMPQSSFVQWCTPVMNLMGVLGQWSYSSLDNAAPALGERAWRMLLIYTAVAVVLLVLAWILYCRRSSETAADPVAVRWAKPVFRYSIALLGGLAGGIGLYAILSIRRSSLHLPLLLLCVMGTGVLAYFAAAMVITKSFKVFRDGWKGAVAVSVVLVAVCLIMKMDLTGFVHRVPAPEEVAGVMISDSYGISKADVCTDPETIADVLAGHQAIVTYGQPTDYAGGWRTVYLGYRLKNGNTIYRRYDLDTKKMESAPELKEAVEKLLNQESVRRDRIVGSSRSLKEMGRLLGGYVECYGRDLRVQMTEEQANAFYDALERDIRNGAGWLYVDGSSDSADTTKEELYVILYIQQQDIAINDLPRDAEESWEVLREILRTANVTGEEMPAAPAEMNK